MLSFAGVFEVEQVRLLAILKLMPRAAEPEFIVDSKGRKRKVVLAVEEYEELLEDLHDLSVALARRDELLIPWEELKRELKADGV